MNINNVIKKQTTVIALTVIGICIGLLGISYAIFFKVDDSTNVQTVSSGSLVVQFGEGSKITTEMLPQTDSEGMATSGYSFSVTNKGSIDMLYDIFIYNDPDASNDFNNTMLPHQYIKVSIDGSDPVLLSELEDSGVTVTSDSNYSSYNLTGENNIKRIVGKDIFVRAAGSGKDVNTHIIKLWITEDAPTSIIGNTVALEIQVFGEADKYVDTAVPIVEKINNLYNEGNSELVVDNYDNVRYIGADPANYIYFNCDDYSNPTAETCEKWRIIGLFKDIATESNEGGFVPEIFKDDLVKIVRDDSIGEMSWDESDSDYPYGNNDWEASSLKYYLDNDYYNSLKNDTTRNMIARSRWKIGGASLWDDAYTFYDYENYLDSSPLDIGLITVSDYGLATSGGSDYSREACLSESLPYWADYRDCNDNNYLFEYGMIQWTMGVHDGYSDVFIIESLDDRGSLSATSPTAVNSVRPALYLKSSTKIIQGDGSIENPFALNV